ncbi:hypothetical protein FXO38_10548 [Capsicum annuum]|nr:hypothetical protein FXO38_10548 [Capsicum annuum]KAF3666419.1 hypothetical protein FXO37_10560 [Capsicum annuum]
MAPRGGAFTQTTLTGGSIQATQSPHELDSPTPNVNTNDSARLRKGRGKTRGKDLEKTKKAMGKMMRNNKENRTKLKSNHFMGSKAFVAICTEINNITDLKALYTSGESSMTIDEIVDVVLGTKSGYIKGFGYGTKSNTTRETQRRTIELEDSLKKVKHEAASA